MCWFVFALFGIGQDVLVSRQLELGAASYGKLNCGSVAVERGFVHYIRGVDTRIRQWMTVMMEMNFDEDLGKGKGEQASSKVQRRVHKY